MLSAAFAALTAIFVKVGAMVTIFGVSFVGEQLSAFNWLGVALITAGAILAASKGG